MKIKTQNKRIILFGLFVLFSMLLELCIGYNLYIDGHFIGTVRSPSAADTILEILRKDTCAPASSSLYPRFVVGTHMSSATDILKNAEKAAGIETEIITDTVSVPFTTEEVKDESLFLGERIVQTEGVPGTRTVVRQIKKQNGAVLSEEVLSDSITAEPVCALFSVGTKPKPPGMGSGEFSLPLSEISVSSPFGRRGLSTHDGVDLAAMEGAPIFAADHGIVTFSGNCEGYGNLIILDHQNGYSTYYAHCSVLYAAVGAVPQKGEVIAEVGSTGRSTGPHLHFEIRKDNTPQNPVTFWEAGLI